MWGSVRRVVGAVCRRVQMATCSHHWHIGSGTARWACCGCQGTADGEWVEADGRRAVCQRPDLPVPTPSTTYLLERVPRLGRVRAPAEEVRGLAPGWRHQVTLDGVRECGDWRTT